MKREVDKLLNQLIVLTEDMAKGHYGRYAELFELTKTGSYPESISRLAESFGMMMVKVEAREFHLEQMIEDLKKAHAELSSAKQRLDSENRTLKRTIRESFSPDQIIGKSPRIQELRSMIRRIADTAVNVLITGETGTGKELIAKSLHFSSSRSHKPFVALNCSALPESILEAELFGIEKGVATGVDGRTGRIEQASGGTLFLDEIGDMPLNAQAKVLRVIEERTVDKLGGRVSVPVDIRVIAATNKNLRVRDEAAAGHFREDLYYRLNVVQLHVPPLRERADDIPLLLNLFLKTVSLRQEMSNRRFDPEALDRLTTYPWPGNVRELKNEVERAVALSVTDTIGFQDFSEEVHAYFISQKAPGPFLSILKGREIELILQILRDTGGNKSETARRLGLSREGLRKKILKYGLDPKETAPIGAGVK
ncbi:MAG: sigma-54-dependent Fis family transcriptional regulator [Nitrospirae bacterium]|nr:sigma-54-dependent Fis family transcriptional regulator [Nitrospirota bacterium]